MARTRQKQRVCLQAESLPEAGHSLPGHDQEEEDGLMEASGLGSPSHPPLVTALERAEMLSQRRWNHLERQRGLGEERWEKGRDKQDGM